MIVAQLLAIDDRAHLLFDKTTQPLEHFAALFYVDIFRKRRDSMDDSKPMHSKSLVICIRNWNIRGLKLIIPQRGAIGGRTLEFA